MAETLPPSQAKFLSQVLLDALQSEHAVTRKVIEAIPAAAAEYRPDPNAMSAQELAWHTVAVEVQFLESVAAGEFTGGAPRPETVVTPADIANWYAAAFAAGCAGITAASGEQLAKVIDFRGLFQLPAVNFLQFVMSHTIHHRGQLSVYLRPMGAKVPAIYGESYDSALARKAAQ
jgi:uncharacterized damage-inducible protein DinB